MNQYFGVDSEKKAAIENDTALTDDQKAELLNTMKVLGLQNLISGYNVFSDMQEKAVDEYQSEVAHIERAALIASGADPLLIDERSAWILCLEKKIEEIDSANLGDAYMAQLAAEAEGLLAKHKELYDQCIAKGLIDPTTPFIPESAVLFEPPVYGFELLPTPVK